MKKLTLFSFLLSAAVLNLNALQLSGTASTAVSNLDQGDSSFVIVDTTGGDTLTAADFTAGVTLTAGTSFGNFYVAAHNAVAGGFGTSVPGNANFNLGDGTTASGDTFYVVAFNTQTGDGITLTAGDTFGILAGANWQLPASNSAILAYGADIAQFATIDGAANTIPAVPEPSAFAMLSGLLALSSVAIRRRA